MRKGFLRVAARERVESCIPGTVGVQRVWWLVVRVDVMIRILGTELKCYKLIYPQE